MDGKRPRNYFVIDYNSFSFLDNYTRPSESSRQQGKEDKPPSLPVAKTVTLMFLFIACVFH